MFQYIVESIKVIMFNMYMDTGQINEIKLFVVIHNATVIYSTGNCGCAGTHSD